MPRHNPNKDIVQEIFRAVDDENIDRLRLFLTTEDGNPNLRNDAGQTLLHYAASRSKYLSVMMLLEGGADPDLKGGMDKWTALHYAAFHDNAKIIELLSQYSASPDVPDMHRQTPLHVAAEEGSPKAARALIKMGADLSLKDNRERLAIDIARTRENEVMDFQMQEFNDVARDLRSAMEKQKRQRAEKEKQFKDDLKKLKGGDRDRYKLGG